MTWSARGYRSIIDYILTNNKLSSVVQNTKVFRGYGVATDHYLLISKICLPQKGYTFIKRFPRQEKVFRVHLLEDLSIKLLYQRRLEQNLTHSPCSLNINAEWQTLKNTRIAITRSDTDKIEYKSLVTMVKRETRKIKRQCWEMFVSRIEHDLHGRQINAYKIIRN
jgi:hypothetical protein